MSLKKLVDISSMKRDLATQVADISFYHGAIVRYEVHLRENEDAQAAASSIIRTNAGNNPH